MVEEIIAGSGSALVQIIILFFCLLGLAVGGIVTTGQFYSRAGDRRVRAKIVGVRTGKSDSSDEVGTVYYPVYEYTAMDGSSVQAESDWGSSSLADKIIGSFMYVIVNPDDPKRVRTMTFGWIIFGVIVLAFGLFCGYCALTKYPITIYTVVVGCLGALYLANKVRKIIKPKALWETREQFRARTSNETLVKREAMPMMDRAGVGQQMKKQFAVQRKVAPLALLVGVALLGGSYFFGRDVLMMTTQGIKTQGQLVSYETSHSADGDTYAPVVKYTDAQQIEHTFKEMWATNRRPWSVGEDVPVIYAGGRERAIIDRGMWGNWWLPALLGLFGGLVSFSALKSLLRASRI